MSGFLCELHHNSKGKFSFRNLIDDFQSRRTDWLTPSGLSCCLPTGTSATFSSVSCCPAFEPLRPPPAPCLKIFSQLTSSESLPTRRNFSEWTQSLVFNVCIHTLNVSFSLPCFHLVLFLSFFEFMTTVGSWLFMSGSYIRARAS